MARRGISNNSENLDRCAFYSRKLMSDTMLAHQPFRASKMALGAATSPTAGEEQIRPKAA
jgi:hypothetical protein